MPGQLDPLLRTLQAFAGTAGRVREPLAAVSLSATLGDFRRVVQNARLAAETLVRPLVAEGLGQPSAEAWTLEELHHGLSVVEQRVLPPAMLSHLQTLIQWGNPTGAPTSTVGEGQALAAVSALVALLSWASSRRPPAGAPPAATVPTVSLGPAAAAGRSASVPRASAAPFLARWLAQPRQGGASGSPSTALLVAVSVAAVVGVAALAELKRPTREAFAALDAVYSTRHEPPPPLECRRGSDATLLPPIATDARALEALGPGASVEAAYLLARANATADRPATSLQTALGCEGFAAAWQLAGEQALAAGKGDDAQADFERAARAAPSFVAPRVARAQLHLAKGALAEAEREARALTLEQPDDPRGYRLLAQALRAAGQLEAATQALCVAARRGSREADEELAARGEHCERPAR